MYIFLTTYSAGDKTKEEKCVRINTKHIQSYVEEPKVSDDDYRTYVHLGGTYGHWVKETPDEIDKLRNPSKVFNYIGSKRVPE